MGQAAPGADRAQWHWVSSGGCHPPRGWVRMSSGLACSWPSWWHWEGLVTGTTGSSRGNEHGCWMMVGVKRSRALSSNQRPSCPPQTNQRPGDTVWHPLPVAGAGRTDQYSAVPGVTSDQPPPASPSSVVTSGGFLVSVTQRPVNVVLLVFYPCCVYKSARGFAIMWFMSRSDIFSANFCLRQDGGELRETNTT